MLTQTELSEFTKNLVKYDRTVILDFVLDKLEPGQEFFFVNYSDGNVIKQRFLGFHTPTIDDKKYHYAIVGADTNFVNHHRDFITQLIAGSFYDHKTDDYPCEKVFLDRQKAISAASRRKLKIFSNMSEVIVHE